MVLPNFPKMSVIIFSKYYFCCVSKCVAFKNLFSVNQLQIINNDFL